MKIFKLVIPSVFILLLLNSCGANKANDSAAISADAFYTSIKAGNIDAAIQNCSESAFAAESKEEWKTAILNNIGLLGPLQSYEKESGWNINTSTESGTTVILKYDVVYENGSSRDSITMIKDADGTMRILNYFWNIKEAKYLDNLNTSIALVKQYLDATGTQNYEAAYAFCGYKAIEVTPKAEWINMLASTYSLTGNLLNYSVDENNATSSIGGDGGAGLGNYYEVKANTNWQNGALTEAFVLYQPSFSDPVKIISHNRE